MRKWITKEIDGIIFEYNTKDVAKYHDMYGHKRDIWDCYTRPSQRKENIFRGWADWFISKQSYDFTVASYNCNFFTIEGYFVDDNQLYYARITPYHNYLYKAIPAELEVNEIV